MKKTVATLILVLFATNLFAQTPSKDRQHRDGTIKLWAGLGVMAIGVGMAATSRTSVTVGTGAFSATASDTSTTRLTLGLGLAGVGGWLVWSGVKDRKAASQPETTVRVLVGKTT